MRLLRVVLVNSFECIVEYDLLNLQLDLAVLVLVDTEFWKAKVNTATAIEA